MSSAPDLRVRVLHKHTATRGWNGYHELVQIGQPLWLDALGRRNNGGSRKWLPLRCNNGDCEARALVSFDSITALADRRLGAHPAELPDISVATSFGGPVVNEDKTAALDLVDCLVCGGLGVVAESHDGGAHAVHCPCTYRRPCDLLCRCSEGPL